MRNHPVEAYFHVKRRISLARPEAGLEPPSKTGERGLKFISPELGAMNNKLSRKSENLDAFSGSEKASISLLCELSVSSEASSGRE